MRLEYQRHERRKRWRCCFFVTGMLVGCASLFYTGTVEEYFGITDSISNLLDRPAGREGGLKRDLAYAQAAESQGGPGPLSQSACDTLLRLINLHLTRGSHGAQLTKDQAVKLLSLLKDPNQNIWDPKIDPKDPDKFETLEVVMDHTGVLDMRTAYEVYLPHSAKRQRVGGGGCHIFLRQNGDLDRKPLFYSKEAEVEEAERLLRTQPTALDEDERAKLRRATDAAVALAAECLVAMFLIASAIVSLFNDRRARTLKIIYALLQLVVAIGLAATLVAWMGPSNMLAYRGCTPGVMLCIYPLIILSMRWRSN